MNTIQTIFYTLLGISFGSFSMYLSIACLRENRFYPHHPVAMLAKRRLSVSEMIPIVSYIFLKGRCRTCQEKFPIRSIIVEIFTGVLFLFIWIRFGLSWETALYTFYGCVLIVIGGIDLENQKILNIMIFPAIGLGLIMIPLFHSDQLG